MQTESHAQRFTEGGIENLRYIIVRIRNDCKGEDKRNCMRGRNTIYTSYEKKKKKS